MSQSYLFHVAHTAHNRVLTIGLCRRVWCNLELLGTKSGIGLGTLLGTEDPKLVRLHAIHLHINTQLETHFAPAHSTQLPLRAVPWSNLRSTQKAAKKAQRVGPAGPPPITPSTPQPRHIAALFKLPTGEWLRSVDTVRTHIHTLDMPQNKRVICLQGLDSV